MTTTPPTSNGVKEISLGNETTLTSLAQLTPNDIVELKLTEEELREVNSDLARYPGGQIETFLNDWITGFLPVERARTGDIQALKLRNVFKKLSGHGVKVDIIGLTLGIYCIVGEEEWHFTL